MPEVNGRTRVSPMRGHGSSLELWGGVEYTCNRVGDQYFDQMDLSGHTERLDDYEKIASLGIRKLRFGLLWERYERDGWDWFDTRLDCMRQLGIEPIAGLLHHGSGPAHTSLLDDAFPEKLAAFAASVAERYPWISAYTPVNEPNTTARFSCLYGIWYPHHMSQASYLRAMLNQLKGTVLSMKAIRRVRPDAKLIQTDDVGNISGTSELRSVWERLNHRQWLSFDLLCGRVDRQHPLFTHLLSGGLTEEEIFWFSENRCPPAVVGVNYYVTSDRYLDHRVELYPPNRRSAEGPFVDVEAVRIRPEGIAGIDSLLREAWDRYKIPVAVTEIHLGCSVDEQIRWLAEIRGGVQRAQNQGVQCVALTIWALLGSFYWNQLVTCENGHYEPGVFDLQDGRPIATDLAKVVAQIAHGQAPRHAALLHQGWWRHESRLCLPCAEELAA